MGRCAGCNRDAEQSGYAGEPAAMQGYCRICNHKLLEYAGPPDRARRPERQDKGTNGFWSWAKGLIVLAVIGIIGVIAILAVVASAVLPH